MAAGFVYGPLYGLLVVVPAATLGATGAFLLGRTVLRGWVRRRMRSSPRAQALDRAVGREGFTLVFLLRLSPLVPFNVVNYALSLSGISAGRYVLATFLGIIPGTWLYVDPGSLVTEAARLSTAATPRTPLHTFLRRRRACRHRHRSCRVGPYRTTRARRGRSARRGVVETGDDRLPCRRRDRAGRRVRVGSRLDGCGAVARIRPHVRSVRACARPARPGGARGLSPAGGRTNRPGWRDGGIQRGGRRRRAGLAARRAARVLDQRLQPLHPAGHRRPLPDSRGLALARPAQQHPPDRRRVGSPDVEGGGAYGDPRRH